MRDAIPSFFNFIHVYCVKSQFKTVHLVNLLMNNTDLQRMNKYANMPLEFAIAFLYNFETFRKRPLKLKWSLRRVVAF